MTMTGTTIKLACKLCRAECWLYPEPEKHINVHEENRYYFPDFWHSSRPVCGFVISLTEECGWWGLPVQDMLKRSWLHEALTRSWKSLWITVIGSVKWWMVIRQLAAANSHENKPHFNMFNNIFSVISASFHFFYIRIY